MFVISADDDFFCFSNYLLGLILLDWSLLQGCSLLWAVFFCMLVNSFIFFSMIIGLLFKTKTN